MLKILFRSLLPLAGVAAVVAGIIYLGNLARDHLREHEQYQIRFADIECQPPPGMKPGEFLDEVQYLSSMPAQLNLLEQQLPEKLAKAFGRHPWVEEVLKVQILPPAQIHVQLTYRRPALAIRWDEQMRAVDGNGILLPPNASTEGLPVYSGKATPPKGPAGTAWGDAKVLAEARKAAKKAE